MIRAVSTMKPTAGCCWASRAPALNNMTQPLKPSEKPVMMINWRRMRFAGFVQFSVVWQKKNAKPNKATADLAISIIGLHQALIGEL